MIVKVMMMIILIMTIIILMMTIIIVMMSMIVMRKYTNEDHTFSHVECHDKHEY